MRKVELRMNELYTYERIKKLVDTTGNKQAAALQLNCSLRTIYRLINTYKREEKAGFIHKNRGRRPATTIPSHIKDAIVSLYQNSYRDCNFTQFCELVEEDFHIKVSDTTINHWLRDQYVVSPKARRATKRAMKQTLQRLQAPPASTSTTRPVIEPLHPLDAHPRRPRCKYMGELIQMDASSYAWINGVIWHLHVAIDDASGRIVGAYFDTQETLQGYYHVFYQILTTYGIPVRFYTDRRTVFEYRRKARVFDNEDSFTQFSYACHQLGVDIKTTSVPQAKGRVERLNATLQSRLPVALRRAGIKKNRGCQSIPKLLRPTI